MRITRDEMLMEIALIVAKRSTCRRVPDGVGAVIARESRVISTGYAGAPSNAPSCDLAGCRLDSPCTRTVHAEANAIVFAAREGISVLGTTLYTTTSPCVECAKLIINSGIVKVCFHRMYRLTDGLDLLERHGVSIEMMKLPGDFNA